jgi:hypothetical protein
VDVEVVDVEVVDRLPKRFGPRWPK